MRIVAAVCLAMVLAGCSGRDGDDPRGTTTTGVETAAPGTSPTATPLATTTPLPDTGEPVFDAEAAMEHARVLSVDIGARVGGSPEELATAEYIRAQLASFGYEAEVQEFTFSGSRFGQAAVTTGEVTIEAARLRGAEGGEVRGPLVFAGLARPEDLEGLDLNGAIALADRGEIEFLRKFQNVQQRGAIALVLINTSESPMTDATLAETVDAPVVGVPQSDGEALRTAAAAGLEATVTADSPRTDSVNVLAKAPGTDRCIILAGAHHDTVPAAPGANDNASGVGHVLELARTFAADGLDRGLCFATFGSEESGLFGSREMAAGMSQADDLPEVMVNFDVTGFGLPVEAIGDPELVEDAIDEAAAEDVSVIAAELPSNAGSDHMSFAEAGTPVLFFTSGEFGAIHSPQDTFEILRLDAFEAIGVAGYLAILDLYDELAAP